MQLLLLQEVCWRDTGCELIQLDTDDNYEFYWFGYKKKVKLFGVGNLIKIEKNVEINKLDTKGQQQRILKLISD